MSLVLGVLGGMGPAATLDFLAKLQALTPAERDQDHIRTIVDINPQVPDRNDPFAKPGPAELPDSIRNPDSRAYNVTHAWYYSPAVVDVTGISTCGTPRDMLISSPSWQQHQKQEHIDFGRILVQQIERHGLKVGGSPYIHLLPPNRDTWREIVADWRRILPAEIEIEKDMLSQAELDLARALTPDDRFTARGRIRVLSTRVAQLRDLDFDRLFDFFVTESNYSRLTARSSAQTTIDLVNETVDKRFGDAGVAQSFEYGTD